METNIPFEYVSFRNQIGKLNRSDQMKNMTNRMKNKVRTNSSSSLHSILHLMLTWTIVSAQYSTNIAHSMGKTSPTSSRPINSHSSLIINANHNHHYPNYADNRNHNYQRVQPNSHLNEIVRHDWNIGHMGNLTATVGRNATFECVFPDLKDFRLAWFHKDRHTLLALHDSVIVKNGRISVRSHANTTFYLTIHDVREEDRGSYMCQLNTVPMRGQVGHLEVNVPPSFVEQSTSSDVDIREGFPASLRCTANGRPKPEISWRREDGNPISLALSNQTAKAVTVAMIKGNYLNISKSNRLHSGAYLCIASNGIPSPISKRIFLGISFPPSIWNNKESVGVYVGSSAILECNLEAYPRPTVYWKKDDQMPPIIHSDQKHEITLIDGNTSYRFILRLRIVNVHKSDIGKYTCMAKNTYGEEKSVVQVYEIERRVVPTQKAVQSLSKSIFMDLFTTKDPVPQAKPPETKPQQTKVTHKVTDNFNLNHESLSPETDLEYETNFISPDRSGGKKFETMASSGANENKVTTMMMSIIGWLILLQLSSTCLIMERVFVL